MGQAKQKRERLGDWYGKPVEPGHPDYVPPPPAEVAPPAPPAVSRPPRGVRTLFALMALTGGIAGMPPPPKMK